MKQVKIFTEGSQKQGFGHIVRCLSLQQAFAEKGVVAKLIINGDFKECGWLVNTQTIFIDWLKKTSQLSSLVNNSPIVIIDSYLAPLSFYKTIENKNQLLVCIDDNNRLSYSENSLIINGSVYGQNINYKNNKKKLVGPSYASLRKDFWEIPPKKIENNLKSVMITFGGGDFRGMTSKILKMLAEDYPNLIKKIVITQAFEEIPKIKKLKDANTQLIFSPNATEMLTLMLESDLAISSGGQTLYELARVGVPTIAITEADNQVKNVSGWKKLRFVKDAGLWNDLNINTTIKSLLCDLEKKTLREQLSKIGKSLIDGRGSLRIVNQLIKFTNI